MDIVTSGDGQNRDLLSQSEYYVALITPSFVTNDKCIGEMRDASALKKDMIALFKVGTIVPDNFYDYDWKLILKFSNNDEFKECSKKLIEYVDNRK